jgi:hypothetical protein
LPIFFMSWYRQKFIEIWLVGSEILFTKHCWQRDRQTDSQSYFFDVK